ncbi:MAG: radical SAM protein, partial [Deltaproteobacteria bacterium]|nr:radical SAM protein [Deltaproteobacteria bacterium]
MVTPPVLLIHPPVVRPCEPPPGLARLAGTLQAHQIPCRMIDANLEGLLDLCRRPITSRDTWTHRAAGRVNQNLEKIRFLSTYRNSDRYRQVVSELGRVLAVQSGVSTIRIGLANYQDQALSPVNSGYLTAASSSPEANPLFPY